jgi:RNA recognition motif-containing protein
MSHHNNKNKRFEDEENDLSSSTFESRLKVKNVSHPSQPQQTSSYGGNNEKTHPKKNRIDSKEVKAIPEHPPQNKESFIDDDDENLGESFECTPWLPPSIEKAKEFKKRETYKNGDWRINAVDLINASDLGPGVSLYFQFTMTMAICLFIMSILSIPSLVFVFHGTRVTAKDRDILGLYRYTLGNLGYDSSSSSYAKDSRCLTQVYQSQNTTCIHFNGNEYSVPDASMWIMYLEILQNLVFMFGVVRLYRRVFETQLNKSNLNFSASDYSVFIKRIPPDTTPEELLKHFSSLYQLSKEDWKGRPPLESARPVQHIDQSGNPIHLNSWVAECIIHKKIGSFISSFKQKQYLMRNLYLYRAKMKMFAENTPHSGGHNLKKFHQSQNQMLQTLAHLDTLAKNNMEKTNIKIINAKDTDVTGVRFNIYHNVDAPSVAAFITFEYAESFARCLNDYEKYSRLPWSLFYPEELKFKGHSLSIEKAPEPDQIIW